MSFSNVPGVLRRRARARHHDVPLAYPIARNDQALAAFVNTWIELKRKDGTLDRLYRYWILGQDPAARQPRWSVIRNVLPWVE
jgi:ABC-type amino acid transport substrate-binding protein